MRLIHFDPDNHLLDIALTSDIAPGFVKKSRELLSQWTGKPWTLKEQKESEVSEDSSYKTLRVQLQEAKEKLIEKARETDLVKKALEVFPDAEIQDVRYLKGREL